MTSAFLMNWYKEQEKEIEAFFKEYFNKLFEEYINKLPDIKDVGKGVNIMEMHCCPVCHSNQIDIRQTREFQGMDGSCTNWFITCQHCHIPNVTLAADNFYNRKFYKTKEDAIQAWNELCEKYTH